MKMFSCSRHLVQLSENNSLCIHVEMPHILLPEWTSSKNSINIINIISNILFMRRKSRESVLLNVFVCTIEHNTFRCGSF